MSTGQTPPPGWYPSERPGFSRYWDGARWTEHYHPSTPGSGAQGGAALGSTSQGGTAQTGAHPHAGAPAGFPGAQGAHPTAPYGGATSYGAATPHPGGPSHAGGGPAQHPGQGAPFAGAGVTHQAAPFGGAPGTAAAGPQPTQKKGLGAGAIVAIVIAVVLILAGGALSVAALSGAFDGRPDAGATSEPSGTPDATASGDAADDAGATPTPDETAVTTGSVEEKCASGEGRNELLASLSMGVSTSAYTENPMDVAFSMEYLGDVCAVTVTAMPATASAFNGNDMLGLLSLVVSHAQEFPDYATHVQMYGVDGSTGQKFSLADAFAELEADPTGVTAESGISWPIDTLVG